jgi:hypothetical protein
VHQLAATCTSVDELIAAVHTGAAVEDDATALIITRPR